jgi:hypothetical protein
MNTADQPDHVQAKALDVYRDDTGVWYVELPPHAIATAVFA